MLHQKKSMITHIVNKVVGTLTSEKLWQGTYRAYVEVLFPSLCPKFLQGSALALLLLNIYMKHLGRRSDTMGWRYHQYTDGTLLYISVSGDSSNIVAIFKCYLKGYLLCIVSEIRTES